ncbi:MAG: hypothetical protein AAFO07_23530, partial [Bacteroidota bacterium]
PQRLRIMFDVIWDILNAPIGFQTKEEIRTHFNFIRQAFIDWNTIAIEDESFEKQKKKIKILIKQAEYVTENI